MLKQTIKNLKSKNDSVEKIKIDLVLSHAISRPKEFIFTHPEYKLSLKEIILFKIYLAKIKRGMPIAYITNHKEFFGEDFYVNKNVLIPRPETELVVELALNEFNCHSEQSEESILLIDIGTGSGCIPIAIAKKIKDKRLKIFATDISKKALKVAKKNASAHKIKIDFLLGDLLSPILKNHNLLTNAHKLIITANLPYGWKEWKNQNSAETIGLKFEPQIALFTGKDGLELYEKFLSQLKILIKNYKIKVIGYLEIDPRQTEKIKFLIKKYLPKANIQIKKDLAGLERVVEIKL